MTLQAPEVLALGAGSLSLGCVGLMGGLSAVLAWVLRAVAGLMLATVVLTAP